MNLHQIDGEIPFLVKGVPSKRKQLELYNAIIVAFLNSIENEVSNFKKK